MSPGNNSSIKPRKTGSKVSNDESMNSLAMDLNKLEIMSKN
jgi:hypothetical protein